MFEQEILDIDTQFSECFQLDSQLQQLVDSFTAVESFGINPTAAAVLKTTGLLAGTSLDAIAVESLSYDAPQGDETQAALEALDGQINDVKTNWATKILSLVKNTANKFTEILSGLFGKAFDLLKRLGEKTWDQTKALGRTIKAHPVKTIFAVVGSIVAVAGIIAFVGARKEVGALALKVSELNKDIKATENVLRNPKLPIGGDIGNLAQKLLKDKLARLLDHRSVLMGQYQSTNTVFLSKLKDMVAAIPWIGGKITAEVTEKAIHVNVGSAAAATTATVQELGWTATTIAELSKKLNSAWTTMRYGLHNFGSFAYDLATKAGHFTWDKISDFRSAVPHHVYKLTGSREAAGVAGQATGFAIMGIIFGITVSAVYAIWRLIKKVVIGGMHLITSTIGSLF